jgi:multidrug efflux pump
MFQLDPAFRTGHVEYKAPGSEWWVQLAGTVVWGLSFATLLTLFLTPAALAAPAVIKRRTGKLVGAVTGRRPEPAPAPGHGLPEAAE